MADRGESALVSAEQAAFRVAESAPFLSSARRPHGASSSSVLACLGADSDYPDAHAHAHAHTHADPAYAQYAPGTGHEPRVRVRVRADDGATVFRAGRLSLVPAPDGANLLLDLAPSGDSTVVGSPFTPDASAAGVRRAAVADVLAMRLAQHWCAARAAADVARWQRRRSSRSGGFVDRWSSLPGGDALRAVSWSRSGCDDPVLAGRLAAPLERTPEALLTALCDAFGTTFAQGAKHSADHGVRVTMNPQALRWQPIAASARFRLGAAGCRLGQSTGLGATFADRSAMVRVLVCGLRPSRMHTIRRDIDAALATIGALVRACCEPPVCIEVGFAPHSCPGSRTGGLPHRGVSDASSSGVAARVGTSRRPWRLGVARSWLGAAAHRCPNFVGVGVAHDPAPAPTTRCLWLHCDEAGRWGHGRLPGVSVSSVSVAPTCGDGWSVDPDPSCVPHACHPCAQPFTRSRCGVA